MVRLGSSGTLLTAVFLHGSLLHLLFNMAIGRRYLTDVVGLYGPARAWVIFIVAGVVGFALSDFAAGVPTIGASGAIFGILMACAILFPDRRVYLLPFPVAMSMRTVVIIMAAFTFLGTFGLGADNVSHLCHLGGMLVGYLYLRRGSFLYSLRNSVSDWQHRRNRKRFEVYMGKHRKEPPSRPDNWVN